MNHQHPIQSKPNKKLSLNWPLKHTWLGKHCHIIIFLATIFLLAAATSLNRIYYSDFYPMNGDFQNYNVYRRVFAGQIPYVDFANYLGVGIIGIIAPILFAFDSFTASIFITHLVSFFLFCLSIFIYLRASNISVSTAAILSSVIPLAILYAPGVNKFAPSIFWPGPSMRMTRAFLPFGIAGASMLWMHFRQGSMASLLDSLSAKKHLSIAGILIGLTFTWSNDFGLACITSGALYTFFIQILRSKSSLKTALISVAVYSAAAIVGAFISMILVTKGNPAAFLSATQGIAQYQFWYFYDTKILQVSDFLRAGILFHVFILINIWICARSLISLRQGQDHQTRIFSAFVSTSVLVAVFIYALGGGGILDSVIQLSVFLFALECIAKFVTVLRLPFGFSNERLAIMASFATLLLSASVASLMYLRIHERETSSTASGQGIRHTLIWGKPKPDPKFAGKEAIFVPELGGYTHFGFSLINAKTKIGKDLIFSTYASALEVMLGQTQPTGYDYIIHVLGDSARAKYLSNFASGNYTYSQTIRETFSIHEPWVQRANWYFYRELYKHYVPQTLTDYSVIWVKSSKSNLLANDCNASTKAGDNQNSADINITCNDTLSGIADVEIAYRSHRVNSISNLFTIHSIVAVIDSSMLRFNKSAFHNYFIPNEAKSYRLPIVVLNGKGHIQIEARPQGAIKLELLAAKANCLFPDFPRKAMELPTL